MKREDFQIADYTYDLPADRIAQHPLSIRDASKLLVMKGTSITEDRFSSLPSWLPEQTLLAWNNTRVIHARLLFFKETGACIEIFCLEPHGDLREINAALQARHSCEWKCLIGNAKKWKEGPLTMPLESDHNVLKAYKIREEQGQYVVRFEWTDAQLQWSDVLEMAGRVPLPPYISREAGAEDNLRYQTVYARNDGSVAAPTAGLHFSDDLIKTLEKKGIQHVNLTLHVGAGTFKPVTTERVADHRMHAEQIILKKEELHKLATHEGPLLAVGTTSLRSLESFYWQGVKLLSGQPVTLPFELEQWECYDAGWLQNTGRREAFDALYDYSCVNRLEEIYGETRLMIIPSYRVRTADILLTNFHQPASTLLLLVAAFAGEQWREAYAFALDHGFRFLSYGDACLFFRADQQA